MSHPRLSLFRLVIGLALIALLIVALTLAAVAQDPDNRDIAATTDEVMAVEEVEPLADRSVSSTTTYYQFISANTFVPYDDDMIYNYYAGGCVYRTGGANHTAHTLQLPEGAEINYLRVYFYDNDSTHNATAYLYAFDGYGNADLIASVGSSGENAYYTSEPSGYFSHVVDNLSEALSISLHYGYATTSDLRICGVQIQYQYTPSITDLPLILNGASP